MSLIALFLITLQAQALECQAEKRTIKNNTLEVKTIKLQNTDYSPGEKLIGDLEEAYFSVALDGNEHVSMITIGPDYTTGNLAKGGLNDQGELKLSYVTPKTTYILTCKK